MSRRVFRGLARRERAGWIFGLTTWQAVACLLLLAPVLWSISRESLLSTLGLAGLCCGLASLVVVPVRGRPAVRWLADVVLHQIGVATGWSRWQSRMAAGLDVEPQEADLPGILSRVSFPDGPVFAHRGRVCLIHDSGDGRWGATARLTHTGVGMLSDEQCERLAHRLGTLLLSMGDREVVDRMSLLVRTVPDDGVPYAVWRGEHETSDAPPLARRVTDELDRTIASVSVRHEVYVTVSGREDTLRKPANAAGGGVEGRARVLYRALDGLEEPLKALGIEQVEWLSGGALAEAIRTGFNPASGRALRSEHLTGQAPPEGMPWAAAGPAHAPSAPVRRYDHDGYSTVTWSVLMPEAGTVFGALSPLLAVRTAGERRCVAIHYEVLDARRAARAVRNYRYRTGVIRDYKSSKGFSATASDDRQAGSARAQERAVAAGHSVVRYAVTNAVTVPSGWEVEDHAARVEQDAAGRFRLLRLDLAHDASFVSACLPVGIGLPRERGGVV